MKVAFIVAPPHGGAGDLVSLLEGASDLVALKDGYVTVPLAHLGYYYTVDKAPYDHVLAAGSQRLFIDKLPHKEEDYRNACRAYCDTIYGRLAQSRGASVVVDGTPGQAKILPVLLKLYPDAKYIIATRNPLASLATALDNGHGGDVLESLARLGGFLRDRNAPCLHVRHDDLSAQPERTARELSDFLGVEVSACGFSGASHGGWADSLLRDKTKLAGVQRLLKGIDPSDFDVLGYPWETMWRPLVESPGAGMALPRRHSSSVKQKLVKGLRSKVEKSGALKKVLSRIRLTCDVLLRD